MAEQAIWPYFTTSTSPCFIQTVPGARAQVTNRAETDGREPVAAVTETRIPDRTRSNPSSNSDRARPPADATVTLRGLRLFRARRPSLLLSKAKQEWLCDRHR